jgi:macrophage erythroblast attacher
VLGYKKSASKLANATGVTSLVDLDIFEHAQHIQHCLSVHRCTEALQWCSENKLGLKKLKVLFDNLVGSGISIAITGVH